MGHMRSLHEEHLMPWPGLAQVFQLERQVIRQKTGEVREERVAGVTSLPGAR
jgi:hypothetical protein